ncbi:DUF4494 domain-containing protein [Reichenbachiella versicolor]|uniref:DUF4494 domain-containing protein n=1 Tax=Reichenbachiella versicolor TaxID=1821036 RepID=UPI000D6DE633|nr:DUF4494 domain-containing protein [Reichenbachiella versicolor]
MATWYSCKVKYEKENDEGVRKLTTDNFLVDAMTYTEAESRIYEAMERDVFGEFTVSNISKTNIGELVQFEPADWWYKCKVSYSTVAENTEKEIKINTYYLVNAEDVKDAYTKVGEALDSMLVPFEIPSIVKTNIEEVYPYHKDDSEEDEDIEEEKPAKFDIDVTDEINEMFSDNESEDYEEGA